LPAFLAVTRADNIVVAADIDIPQVGKLSQPVPLADRPDIVIAPLPQDATGNSPMTARGTLSASLEERTQTTKLFFAY